MVLSLSLRERLGEGAFCFLWEKVGMRAVLSPSPFGRG